MSRRRRSASARSEVSMVCHAAGAAFTEPSGGASRERNAAHLLREVPGLRRTGCASRPPRAPPAGRASRAASKATWAATRRRHGRRGSCGSSVSGGKGDATLNGPCRQWRPRPHRRAGREQFPPRAVQSWLDRQTQKAYDQRWPMGERPLDRHAYHGAGRRQHDVPVGSRCHEQTGEVVRCRLGDG